MQSEARVRLEQEIRAHCDGGRFRDAVTLGVRGFGPELFGYLVAITKNDADANDAFSLFCEDLWRGLPRFRWASSFRTWAYTLARHAAFRLGRDPERRNPKVPIPESHDLQELAVEIRTITMLGLRSEPASKIARLRDQLDPDDRTLLILRIDRKLPWQDIARVMADDPQAPEAAITKMSAMLRKRFERVKERLRSLAAQA